MSKLQYPRAVPGESPRPCEYVELDSDTDTFTLRGDDGSILEQRPLTDEERDAVELPVTPARLRSLTEAVDQLILDALMGF